MRFWLLYYSICNAEAHAMVYLQSRLLVLISQVAPNFSKENQNHRRCNKFQCLTAPQHVFFFHTFKLLFMIDLINRFACMHGSVHDVVASGIP